jgi:hypothetical protein
MDMDQVNNEIEMDQDKEDEDKDIRVYLPGQALEKDEVLEADQSAYEMLHSMNVKWPCLSFDILWDQLGDERCTFPATTYVVTGTQADQANNNEVLVMKMSQLAKTKNDDGNQSDDDSDDDDVDEDPILEYKSMKHVGGVNRIRVRLEENWLSLICLDRTQYRECLADKYSVCIIYRPCLSAISRLLLLGPTLERFTSGISPLTSVLWTSPELLSLSQPRSPSTLSSLTDGAKVLQWTGPRRFLDVC